MMVRVGTIVRSLRLGPSTSGATGRSFPRKSRRQCARAAIGWGAAAFLLATAGLAGTVETIKPEWRDPEFGVRVHQLKTWKEQAPHRPLLVVLGSSRTQMGICPAAMDFPDEPGSPVVYNFGYRSARPSRAWFQLMRLARADLKPDRVLMQISLVDLLGSPREVLVPTDWGDRFDVTDLKWAAPSRDFSDPLMRRWVTARLLGWTEHRGTILSDVLPAWQPTAQRFNYYWERMDRYGFAPHHLESQSPQQQARALARSRSIHAMHLAGGGSSNVSLRVLGDVAAYCRSEQIPLALYWSPESATYRTWYTPAARDRAAALERRLIEDLGVPIFAAPEGLPDTDFVDGFHMLRRGAEKYSRWLAETHLKPWLAQSAK